MGQPYIDKKGIWHADQFSEYLISPHDNTIKIESDGSLWTHIFHHNNPASNLFASTDNFTNALYKNENLWFDFSLCNNVDKWEFLVIQAATAGAVEKKIRWLQSVNPMVAVYGDVDNTDITYITSSEYNTSTWGGLYKKNSSAYLVANNGNSGNWWGATGCWTAYQGGLPAFFGEICSTGYYDIYLRIDNLANTKATITKGSAITENQLYEI